MRFKPRVKFNQNIYTLQKRNRRKMANSRAIIAIPTFQVKLFAILLHLADVTEIRFMSLGSDSLPYADFPCPLTVSSKRWMTVSLLTHFANSSSWFDTWGNKIIPSRLVFSPKLFFNKRSKTLLITWLTYRNIYCYYLNVRKNYTTANGKQLKTVITLKATVTINYNFSSTCCGFGILYPCWSKLAIFLPSIRG